MVVRERRNNMLIVLIALEIIAILIFLTSLKSLIGGLNDTRDTEYELIDRLAKGGYNIYRVLYKHSKY